MKKIIDNLVVISACLTSFLVICTLLNSYHFVYLGLIFNSYLPIQLGAAITMILVGLKFMFTEYGRRRFVYFAFSIVIASALLISISVVR